MGKGGGGPTQSTSYSTNLPEYARPYVETMLGATQQQLFNTSPQAPTYDDAGNQTNKGAVDITGFKGYQPYSTNPNDYVAGFSPLQQQAQSGAANMQLPGQYGMATNAALGGLGAYSNLGNAAANQQFMNPYLQNALTPQLEEMRRQYGVTGQQQQGAATGAGAFGGSREALMAAENSRNMNTAMNQAIGQGYNTAFNNAQQMQLAQAQGYGQAASGLGSLAGQMLQGQQGIYNLQNQFGQQQQAQEQQKINQSIQDYATAQQYPMMQLGFMSNMLRGLPMQSTTTQQYQAQAPMAQQAAGLLGAYGSYKGAFKEGGEVGLGYANRGVVDSMRDRLETMAETDPDGLKKLIAQSSSKEVKEMGNEILSGIALGNTGKLGTNMAGGGIIAFEDGGEVEHFYNQGKVEDPDNPYGYSGFGEVASYDPRTAIGAQLAPFERLGNAIYGFGFKTKHQIQQEVKERAAKAEKDAAEKEDKKDDKKDAGAPPAAAPAAAPTGGNNPPTGIAGAMPNLTGYKKAFYDATGIKEGPGEKNQALMSYLEGDQGKLGERYGAAERANKAAAFLRAGQNARGILAGATEGAETYLKGEAELQKQRRAEEGQIIKMQADLEAARDAKARGDFDAYTKHMESAADRQNRLEVARIGAAAHGAAGQYTEQQIKNIQSAYKERTGKDLPYDEALSRLTELKTTSDEAKKQDMVKSAFTEAQKSISPGGANYTQYKKLLEKDPAAAKQFVTDLATQHYQGMQAAINAVTGTPSSGKVDTSNPLLSGKG